MALNYALLSRDLSKNLHHHKIQIAFAAILAFSMPFIATLSTAQADATNTPSAFCTRPGFGGTGAGPVPYPPPMAGRR